MGVLVSRFRESEILKIIALNYRIDSFTAANCDFSNLLPCSCSWLDFTGKIRPRMALPFN